MTRFNLSNLTPMQAARTNAALDAPIRVNGLVTTWRAHIAGLADASKTTGDGMIDWSRTKFNRMDNREQAAYEARLKGRTYYYVGDWKVPKLVFDAVADIPATVAA